MRKPKPTGIVSKKKLAYLLKRYPELAKLRDAHLKQGATAR